MVVFHLDVKGDAPLFRQIYEKIRNFIEQGALKPGDRLPPTRAMAERLGVHRSTVYKAYEELWAFGYLESRPGSYTTVRKKQRLASPGTDPSCAPFDFSKKSHPAAAHVHRLYKELQARREQPVPPGTIDFSLFELDPRLLPVEEFRKCMNTVLCNQGPELMGYGDARGYMPLREFISKRLRIHGISVGPEEILVTNGAQQAFDFVLKLLTRPGCRAIVEAPTYALVLPLLHYFQVEIQGIPMGEEGMDLDRLEQELAGRGAAFVYTIPNFQNPTGITTSQAHRERLLRLCREYETPLIEDAFEEEMKYFGKVPLSIKSMDRHQMVIYLGSFSKVLFPGIRVGWMAASRDCIERLSALKRYFDLSPNMPIQAALADFCMKGGYDIHVKRMHRAFRKRMQAALDGLKRYCTFPGVTWTRPAGGYLIWLTLDGAQGREAKVADAFLRHGVKVLTGRVFFSEPVEETYFRLCISTLNEEEIREGTRRLGAALAEIYRP